MKYPDQSDDGFPIRLVRCPRCGGIVARVYSDCEIRFRIHDFKSRDLGRQSLERRPYLWPDEHEREQLVADYPGGARCGRCSVGFPLREVFRAGQWLVSRGRSATKLRSDVDTL